MTKFIRSISIMTLITIGFSQFTFAQKTATTDDGKKVKLYDNGTWEYMKNQDIDENQPTFNLTINNEITLAIQNGEISNFGSLKGGSTNYYWSGDDKGKVSQIGNIQISYYWSGSDKGKVSKIGNTPISYYWSGDDEGKVSKIGNIQISYYWSGDDKGKISKIGNIQISYYWSGDDKGKISKIEGSIPNVSLSVN